MHYQQSLFSDDLAGKRNIAVVTEVQDPNVLIIGIVGQPPFVPDYYHDISLTHDHRVLKRWVQGLVRTNILVWCSKRSSVQEVLSQYIMTCDTSSQRIS